MGWLRRLFGGDAQAQPSPSRTTHGLPSRHQNFQVTTFTEQRADATRDIVGEAFRQENLAYLLSTARPGQWSDAILEREPDNAQDPNAVRVIMLTRDGGSGALVGYLSREDAIAYWAVFARIAPSAILTQATIIPGHDRARDGSPIPGVRVRLGSPGEMLGELWTDGRGADPAHPWRGQLVCFSGQSSRAIFGTPLDRDGQAWLARKAGCEVWPRMTKKVQLCVASSVDVDTEKVRKAEEQGTPVILEDEFWARVGFPLDHW